MSVCLNCAFLEDGRVISIVVKDKEKETLALFKGTIKFKNSAFITCDAGQLQLWFATTKRQGETIWLPDDDTAANDLVNGKTHPDIQTVITKEPLKSSRSIGQLLKENNLKDPLPGQIHVLVKMPEDADATREKKLDSFAKFLKECPMRGVLPKEGDFLQLFAWSDEDCGEVKNIKEIGDIVGFTGSKFFVRKEVLCVLENIKSFKKNFDSGKLTNQFVLLGSPGVGKSCVLALLCFYVAATTDYPVLWYRHAQSGRDEIVTRLFYEGNYYEWDDPSAEIYHFVYDEIESSTGGIFWACLDGLDQDQFALFDQLVLTNRFTLLATSRRFDVKSDAADCITRCLLPYWKQADLEDLARKIKDPKEEDIDSRYFVSGGSLRDFLSVCARIRVSSALDVIESPEHARTLLGAIGCATNKQIDRIRVWGVKEVATATCYVDPDAWSAIVTSSLALRRLVAFMQPNFFEELVGIARGMKDDRLEGVALEGYFHALMRHQRSIVVDYCKYDNVNRSDETNWRNIMLRESGLIAPGLVKNVHWAGENVDRCVGIVKEWASDPSKHDYWIPTDSLCQTIDAVARWKFPDKQERICFLQLTKAQIHTCKAKILWKLAQPFIEKGLAVCYIALLLSEKKDARFKFRLKPAVIEDQEVLKHIPLYVATYRLSTTE